jgi:hypothetical protein
MRAIEIAPLIRVATTAVYRMLCLGRFAAPSDRRQIPPIGVGAKKDRFSQ